MKFRTETIGDATLILGDCREVLDTIGPVDAVVTDPPYGIGYQRGSGGKGKQRHRTGRNDNVPICGDDKPFDPEPWLAWPCVIWGANHFSNRLPHGRWLAWNKLGSLKSWDDFSDVEFAWHNERGADRIFSLLWKGLVQGVKEGQNGERWHPTQKPVALMEWCLGFVSNASSVLDPYMGSGTTGVACVNLGRRFVGIEIDSGYFDIACRRVEEAYKQPRLFEEPVPKAVQETLL